VAKERLALYTAIAPTVGALADATGLVIPIDFRLPLGFGARVVRAWALGFANLGTLTGAATIGLSLDPSEATPTSVGQIYDNLDVIEHWDYDQSLVTQGGMALFGSSGVDMTPYDVLIARNLSAVVFNGSGGIMTSFALKCLFKLVELSDPEMSDVLARQR